MEAFINKMRRLKGVRKQLIVEEAWKALSSANMAEYLRYMYKTVRKYYGEAIVVTQEVDDICFSTRSSKAHASPSTQSGMLPYRCLHIP